ncbi:MAG: hypothetical protein P8107_13345, partial [Spirochaetia bacterium]
VITIAAMSIYYYALVDEHLYRHALRGFDLSDVIVYPFILLRKNWFRYQNDKVQIYSISGPASLSCCSRN